MSASTLHEALDELDPRILADMENVRAALEAQGASAATGFLRTLERAEQICRHHGRLASPEDMPAIEELTEGIAAAGEVLQEVCRSVIH